MKSTANRFDVLAQLEPEPPRASESPPAEGVPVLAELAFLEIQEGVTTLDDVMMQLQSMIARNVDMRTPLKFKTSGMPGQRSPGQSVIPNVPGPPRTKPPSPPRVSIPQAGPDWPKLDLSSIVTNTSEARSRSPSPSPSRQPDAKGVPNPNVSQGPRQPKPPSSPSRKAQFMYSLGTDHRGRARSTSKGRNPPTPSIQVDDVHVVNEAGADSIRVLSPSQRGRGFDIPDASRNSPTSGRSLSPTSPIAQAQPFANAPRSTSPGHSQTRRSPSPDYIPQTLYSSVISGAIPRYLHANDPLLATRVDQIEIHLRQITSVLVESIDTEDDETEPEADTPMEIKAVQRDVSELKKAMEGANAVVRRALRGSGKIHSRSMYETFADVITKHTGIEYGIYSGHFVNKFKTFVLMFKTEFMGKPERLKRIAAAEALSTTKATAAAAASTLRRSASASGRGGGARRTSAPDVQGAPKQEQASRSTSPQTKEEIGAEGLSPYPPLTKEELDQCNESLKEYFGSRVEKIKARMKSKGILTADWEKLITRNFLVWLVDYYNPLRTGGGKYAHRSALPEVLSTAMAYSELADTPAQVVQFAKTSNWPSWNKDQGARALLSLEPRPWTSLAFTGAAANEFKSASRELKPLSRIKGSEIC
ncbi:hypothetical protein SCHPADRAFT_944489 [Schizopora paradoxa]|uniref:Uncharacterized protein n=1 Tax=Schizopora paradoxa TaxID=27342 RepID=A0A0H2RAJ5_9AGAM|nr:hypothetical protein SCHPADRAFT_944489 [Schizopora paradoxa]